MDDPKPEPNEEMKDSARDLLLLCPVDAANDEDFNAAVQHIAQWGAEVQAEAKREGARLALEQVLDQVEKHEDGCSYNGHQCYCPCADQIEQAIRALLPSEPQAEPEVK